MGATVARWRMSPGEGESEASDGGEREMGQATAIQIERMQDGQTCTAVACCVLCPGVSGYKHHWMASC